MNAQHPKDFFISYNSKDLGWAEWIAWQLEANGYETVIQAWDFRPGNNFPIAMQRGLAEADRVILVLSENFLASRFTQPEWAAAFVQDPDGTLRKVIPVRVGECATSGLFPGLIYIDLVKKTKEEAILDLLAGVRNGRLKPADEPALPHSHEMKLALSAPPQNPIPTQERVKCPGTLKENHGALCNLLSERMSEETSRSGMRTLVVSGTLGSDATSITNAALSFLACSNVSVNLAQADRELSPQLCFLKRISEALGRERTPNFFATWSRHETCLKIAGRVRTIVDQSGYGSIRQSLQSLVRRKEDKEHQRDVIAVLRRLLSDEDDVELVLRPQQALTIALLKDIAATEGNLQVCHFHGLQGQSEAPLINLLARFAELELPTSTLLIVISLEAHPDSFPLIRQLPTFHVHTASTSDVLRYLRGDKPPSGNELSGCDDLIARLSGGSLRLAAFLQERPRLVQVLAALNDHGQTQTALTAADGWLLIAVAYDVTPNLLSAVLDMSDIDSHLVADEIPDDFDGSRRLPLEIAAAVVTNASLTSIARVARLIEDTLSLLATSDTGSHALPTRVAIASAFHAVLGSGKFSRLDACLLQNFRTSLSYCVFIRNALTRLQVLGAIPHDSMKEVATRLQLIEKIEEGDAGDERVTGFFESIGGNAAEFAVTERAIAYYQLGHCYFSSGHDDLAIIALEYAIELDSTYHNAFSLLGVLYGARKQHEKAGSALREAIRLKGTYAFAHFNLGTLYERRGHLVEASHAYIAAMTSDPSFYEAAYNLSNTLLKLNLVSEAATVATFTGAIAEELRLEPIFNIANAVAGMGDIRGAIKLFRYCLDLRREPRIAFNLGLAYACNSQAESAVELLKEAERLAVAEGDKQINSASLQLRLDVKSGRTYSWPVQQTAEPLTKNRAASLRHDLTALFATLTKHGLGKGAHGILRTVTRVSARSGLSASVVSKSATPQHIRYARLPSYGGG